MAKTIEITIGTDRTLRLTVSSKDLATGIKTRQDLTGAFVYFRVLRSDETTELVAKDNDPAALNVGITLADQIDPDTRGQADIEIDHLDFIGDEPGSKLLFAALVRLDPAGTDKRYEVARGNWKLCKDWIVIP
jgi:hypothetical protein